MDIIQTLETTHVAKDTPMLFSGSVRATYCLAGSTQPRGVAGPMVCRQKNWGPGWGVDGDAAQMHLGPDHGRAGTVHQNGPWGMVFALIVSPLCSTNTKFTGETHGQRNLQQQSGEGQFSQRNNAHHTSPRSG